jgi:hypothetical protein
MTAPDPTWPAILTNQDWQKKKGTIAKVAGKTGIGEQMTKAQKAFAKINWKAFDAREISPQDRDVDKIMKAKQNAMQLYKTTVEPARNELKKLRDMSKKLSDEWKKKTAIPSSATKHALEVAKSADFFSLTLLGNSDTMTSRLKTFDTMLDVKRKAAAEETKKLAVTVGNLETALKDVAKTPTKKAWSDGNTSAHQRCRSMCNTIRNVPQLKAKYWKTWEAFGNEYHRDAPDGPKEAEVMKKKIATVDSELKKFKANYQKDLAG